MQTIRPVQPARVENGVLQYLDIEASPPEWKDKLCPYHGNGSRVCCTTDCALFWYASSNSVMLMCAHTIIALHEHVAIDHHAMDSAVS